MGAAADGAEVTPGITGASSMTVAAPDSSLGPCGGFPEGGFDDWLAMFSLFLPVGPGRPVGPGGPGEPAAGATDGAGAGGAAGTATAKAMGGALSTGADLCPGGNSVATYSPSASASV